MLFVILFKDKPNQAELRSRLLQAHIDWLELHKDVIPIGGSLRKNLGETPQGGMWVADAESKEALVALMQTDPFLQAGLRESYEILHWSKANAERKALI